MYSKEEAKAIRVEFWNKLNNRTRRLPAQKGKRKNWIKDNTGIKGLDLRFDVNREKAIVALEINHINENRRIVLYEKLLACKSIFESEFGEPLTWEYLYIKDNEQQVCRVYVEQQGDINNKELYSQMIYFLIDRMVRLEKAFLEVKDYLKSNINET